jgi:hypothetical protein
LRLGAFARLIIFSREASLPETGLPVGRQAGLKMHSINQKIETFISFISIISIIFKN